MSSSVFAPLKSIFDRDNLRASLGILIFVTWLSAFITSGKLGTHYPHVPWFLASHAIAYFALARFVPQTHLKRLAIIGAMVSGALTSIFSFLPASLHPWMMALIGILTAPLLPLALISCAQSTAPMTSAMLGVVLSKVIALTITVLPIELPIKLILIGVCLVAVPSLSASNQAQEPTNDIQQVLPYALFIFVLHLTAGLMYSHLRPQYNAMGLWPHLDRLLYSLGILVSFWWVKASPFRACVAISVMVMIAFVLGYSLEAPYGILMSTMTMLFAMGINDIFILGLVLSIQHTLKGTGYLQGTVLASIFMGIWLGKWIGPAPQSISFAALVILNLSLLVLLRKATQDKASFISIQPEISNNLETAKPIAPSELEKIKLTDFPISINNALSEQEQRVLKHVLIFSTYKDVAKHLDISESTVKTHIQRIYKKLGVYNRVGLEQLIAQHHNRATDQT